MVRARTIAGEKRKTAKEKDNAKVAARDEYWAELEKPEDEQMSMRDVADKHGVSHVTLSRLVKGSPTIAEFNAAKQHLTPAEEDVLATFLIGMGKRGFPLTHRRISERASAMLVAKGLPDTIGQDWVTRFLHRHPGLHTYRATPLDKVRSNGYRKDVMADYWDTLQELFDEHKPDVDRKFGADEVGVNLGLASKALVIAEVGQRVQHLQQNGSRENVTVIETICADGTVLTPTVIFKGQHFMSKWAENNPDNAKYVVLSPLVDSN